MPIYEFKCNNGHIIEELYLSIPKVLPESIPCKHCYSQQTIVGRNLAYRIISQVAPPYIAESTRIGINKEGRVELLHHKYDRPSEGFEVKELKGVRERDKFENQQMKQMEVGAKIEAYRRESMQSEITKERHDNIKATLNTYDNQTQTLLKDAMERTNKKNSKKRDIKSPKFYIAANHEHVK